MSEKINLRKKQVEPPAALPQAARVVPGITGKIPFQVGNLVLTDLEKRELTKVGWKEGDPIPNLSEHVATALAAEQAKEKKVAPAAYDETTTPTPKIPEAVSIESLPPQKRKEIEEAIVRMREEAAATMARQKEGRPAFQASDPSVERALAFAEMQQASQPKIGIEDDMAGKGRARAAITRPDQSVPLRTRPERPVPPPEAPGGGTAAATPRTSPDPGTPPPVAPAASQAPTAAGAQLELLHCPHCQWDLSVTDTVVTTLEDRRTYTAALLGGTRFKKEYSLLDGALRVIFRETTAPEADTILKQLFMDGVSGRVKDGAMIMRRAQDYQLACMLDTVWLSDNRSIRLATIDQYEVDADDTTTGLPEILDHVWKEAVPTDSMRRILRDLHSEFDNLLAKLEVESRQEGFTKATGVQR